MSCFIGKGISLIAITISLNVLTIRFPSFFAAFIFSSSSGVGGYSLVNNTEIKMVIIDTIAPIPKAQ